MVEPLVDDRYGDLDGDGTPNWIRRYIRSLLIRMKCRIFRLQIITSRSSGTHTTLNQTVRLLVYGIDILPVYRIC